MYFQRVGRASEDGMGAIYEEEIEVLPPNLSAFALPFIPMDHGVISVFVTDCRANLESEKRIWDLWLYFMYIE